MKHYFCLRRVKTFIMRRHRLMGFIILMFFNVLFHIIIVRQEESGKLYSNVPTPSKIFSENSTVLEFPFGNEDVFATLLLEKDVFVMYYAPWSVQSMHAREHFDSAASLFQDQVYFVAINCWHIGGDCKEKRNLITFPSFYFYKQDFEGFNYAGIPRSDLLVHFVELMMEPVEVINSREHLMSFMTRHETSAISFFNFASTYEPVGFDQIYLTALKFIEADATNVLRFAITTNSSVASLISLHLVSSMSLVKGGKSINTYAFGSNVSSVDIFQWINLHRGEPSIKWLQLSKMKSLALSNELKKGPALLLFLPYYPLSLQHEAFFEMHKVSLTYYGCNETKPIWNKFIEQLLVKDRKYNNVLQESCRGQKVHASPGGFSNLRQICCTFVIELGSDICIETNVKQFDLCYLFTESSNFYKNLIQLYADESNRIFTCFEMLLTYSTESLVTICSGTKRNNDFARIIRQQKSEHENGTHRIDPKVCSKWEKYFSNGWLYDKHFIHLRKDGYSYPNDFIGSGCHNNQSIRFYVLDIFENDAFIANLGLLKVSHPMLLFIDVKREILHKFDEYISESSLVQFITSHRTSDSISSHFRNHGLQKKESSIVQITSSNFKDFVINNQKMVIVLYYSNWCGFCSTFAHIYITLAEQFSCLPGLSFARLDADSNDISQQHSSPYYPSIVLFTRKNEIIPFSKHNPRSFSLLMNFIKYHSSKDRVRPFAHLCDKECINLNMRKLRRKLTTILAKINLIDYVLSKNVLDFHDHNCIRKELVRKFLELEIARNLFGILHKPITGNFLEKHKISFLMRKFSLFRTKLKHLPKC